MLQVTEQDSGLRIQTGFIQHKITQGHIWITSQDITSILNKYEPDIVKKRTEFIDWWILRTIYLRFLVKILIHMTWNRHQTIVETNVDLHYNNIYPGKYLKCCMQNADYIGIKVTMGHKTNITGYGAL